MKKNIAGQHIGAQMITAADGTNFTGVVSMLVTKDGVQAAGLGVAPVHLGSGYYDYSPTQADTNADNVGFTFSGTGAITASVTRDPTFPQSVDNDVAAQLTKASVEAIDHAPMRGTDSANTVVPPTVAQLNARTLLSAAYATPTNITAAVGVTLAADQAVDVTKIGGVAIAATNLSRSTEGLLNALCVGVPTTTSIPTDFTQTAVNHFKGTLYIVSGVAQGQKGMITGYTGTGTIGTFTVTDLVTAPVAGDRVVVG